MGKVWSVQRLTLEQMDEAASVMRRSFDAALPWLAARHTPAKDRWFFCSVLFPAGPIWGAYRGNALAGVMALRPGWIDQLYVAPEHQGAGAGTALLGLAKRAGPPLELWTFQSNHAARRFYERQGFMPVEFSNGSRNEEGEPDVRYRWAGGR